MRPVITVDQLFFTYPGVAQPALHNLSFTVEAGEFVGITGPAGAGKSTLVLCVNGIIPHFQDGNFQGRVLINGLDTFKISCAEISRQVGSVFPDPEAQIVAPTVEDEIAFGLENFGVEPAVIEARISEALDLIGIAQLRYRTTSELSGGQKQRVAIAAAIALRPEILVLDEPTSELDPIGTMEVFQVLKQLNEEYHLTVMVVEQKINILMEYIRRLLILEQGRLVADQDPRTVIGAPELLSRIGLKAPPVSELAFLLKQDGIYQGALPLNVDEAYLGIRRVLEVEHD
jgi:energy-coupling factor transport system ATP-binding protein